MVKPQAPNRLKKIIEKVSVRVDKIKEYGISNLSCAYTGKTNIKFTNSNFFEVRGIKNHRQLVVEPILCDINLPAFSFFEKIFGAQVLKKKAVRGPFKSIQNISKFRKMWLFLHIRNQISCSPCVVSPFPLGFV